MAPPTSRPRRGPGWLRTCCTSTLATCGPHTLRQGLLLCLTVQLLAAGLKQSYSRPLVAIERAPLIPTPPTHTRAHVSARTHVRTHARTHAGVHASRCARTHARTQVCTHARTHMHAHTHTHARTHAHARTHSRTRTHARTHTTHAHTHTYARMHTHACTHASVFVLLLRSVDSSS